MLWSMAHVRNWFDTLGPSRMENVSIHDVTQAALLAVHHVTVLHPIGKVVVGNDMNYMYGTRE